MTSTLRTFVSLTPLLQGPTFIAAGAGPAGQGLDARQEPIAKVLCAPLGSVPATAEPFCPALCSQLWLLQSPVLAPEAAQSLQGSSGCRVGKGGSSPGSTGPVSHTESHHLGDRDRSHPCQTGAGGDLPGRAWTATSCAAGWHCVRNSIHQLSVRWEHWDLDSESPAHTPQRPRECPQLHTGVWSPLKHRSQSVLKDRHVSA